MKKRRTVKQNNRKIILDFARKVQEFSIADVSLKTGISKTTIKKVLDYYISLELVRESGKGGSSDEGGKRPVLFQFNNEYGYIVSIHFGPGFIKGLLTDMRGDSVHSTHLSVGRLSVSEFVEQVITLIGEFGSLSVLKGRPVLAYVLGLAGVVDPVNGISIYSPHYDEWGSNVPVMSMIRERIGYDVPLYLENINRYQAFAERSFGSARGIDNFLIVDAIEEGVGAGIVLNGTIRHGAQYLSGEIGHMVLSPRDSFPCICGGHGCFEAMVSRKRILQLISDGREEYPDSLIFSSGNEPDLDSIFSAVDREDPFACSILDDIAFWFAMGLNNIVMINDPQLVILQGIYTRAGDRFLETVTGFLNKLAFPVLSRELTIIYSKLGADRGVLGGAAYAIWDYFETSDIYESAG